MKLAGVGVAFLAVMVSVTSASGQSDSGLARCSKIANNADRLACYDALSASPAAGSPAGAAAGPASGTGAATAAPVPQAAPATPIVAPSRQVQPQEFGSETLPEPPRNADDGSGTTSPEPIDSITATVTSYSFDKFGRFVVVLDNGQVWSQIRGDTDVAKFRDDRPNTVAVSRGFLGSYDLVLNDMGTIFKVRRTK